MRASAGENGRRRVAESGGQRCGGEPASPSRSVCSRSIADRRADVYEIPFLREKNGCGRMRISVWGSEVLYVGIRSFVLLSFLLFVAACFGFSEHCFGIPSVGG